LNARCRVVTGRANPPTYLAPGLSQNSPRKSTTGLSLGPAPATASGSPRGLFGGDRALAKQPPEVAQTEIISASKTRKPNKKEKKTQEPHLKRGYSFQRGGGDLESLHSRNIWGTPTAAPAATTGAPRAARVRLAGCSALFFYPNGTILTLGSSYINGG
jgi:hypothetical protein